MTNPRTEDSATRPAGSHRTPGPSTPPAHPPAATPPPPHAPTATTATHAVGETHALSRVTPPPSKSNPGAASAKSGIGSFVAWVLVAAISVGGWYTRAQWWPWVQAKISRQPPVAGGPGGPGGKMGARPIPVVTTTVTQRNMDLFLNGLGTVTAFNAVTVRSRVDGELVKVAFTEGQMVKEGDLLAEIDPRPFQRLLEQAQGSLNRDKASLELANAMLSRTEGLLKSQATTQQLYDQQLATVKQAEAVVEVDESLVDNAKLQLTYTKIISPITGRVGLRLVDRGNMVRANDTTGLLVITQLEPISLVFTIPQDDIPRVQREMQKSSALTVEAFDRDFQNRLAVGKLTAIDNQVDATTGTLRLKATFDNKDHALFPNQFVNARLKVETLEDAVVVASSAIQRGPSNQYVYVVKGDNTVELRDVQTGPTEGDDTAITTGLKGGELVVTDGVDKLIPGSLVSLPGKAEKGKKPGAPGPGAAGGSEAPAEASPSKGQAQETPAKPDARPLVGEKRPA